MQLLHGWRSSLDQLLSIFKFRKRRKIRSAQKRQKHVQATEWLAIREREDSRERERGEVGLSREGRELDKTRRGVTLGARSKDTG